MSQGHLGRSQGIENRFKEPRFVPLVVEPLAEPKVPAKSNEKAVRSVSFYDNRHQQYSCKNYSHRPRIGHRQAIAHRKY